MNKYKIVFRNGRVVFDKASKPLDIIRKYDLTSKANLGYVLYQI